MTQVLLVDDEPMLIRSLEQTLNNEISTTNILKAHSGMGAIELLKKNPVDIVITDIRMPGMDGIALSKYIHENFPTTKCILLSGYTEFEYAQSALKYSVVDYLIKPVKDEELIKVTNNTIQLLNEERKRISSQKKYRQTLPILRSQLLNDFLQGKVRLDKELAKKLENYNVPIGYNDKFLMLLIRMEKWFENSYTEDLSIFKYAVINLLDDSLKDEFKFWKGNDQFETLIYIVTSKNVNEVKEVHSLVIQIMNQVQSQIKSFLKGEVSILVSKPGVFPNDLLPVYEKTLNQFWKLPKKELLSIQKNNDETHSLKTIKSLYQAPTFTQLLELGRWQDAKNKLISLKKEISDTNMDTEAHKNEIFYTVFQAFTHLAHMKGKSLWEMIGNNIDMLNGPHYFKNIPHLVRWSIEMINGLEAIYNTDEGTSNQEIIEKVQKFVEMNVEDATLKSIADHVNIHPVYLSTLYKNKSNENLSDFILRCKMEKAKELLLTSNTKIFKIAEKCGFHNPPYFSKLFKNYYGITPQNFRERYRKIT